MVKEKEFNTISLAKIICMILVVFTHACAIYRSNWGGIIAVHPSKVLGLMNYWLSTFITQTFAFASGYLFYMLRHEKEKYRSASTDIFNRLKRLILPYIFFSLFWAIPFGIKFESLQLSTAFENYALAKAPAQLWFLVMLFLEFLLFYYVEDWLETKDYKICIVIFLFVFYIAIILAVFLPIMSFLQIKTFMQYALFFYVGTLLRKGVIKPMQKYIGIVVVCLIEVVIVILNYFIFIDSDFFVFSLIRVVLIPIISLNGIYLLLSVLYRISGKTLKKILNSNVFVILSDCSMGIYLIHQQLMYVCVDLLNLNNLSPFITFSLSFFIVFVASLFLIIILRKFKWFRVLFLGENS